MRKISVDGQKVKWLSIQWLQVRHAEPTKLYYKYTVQPDAAFSCVNLARPGRNSDIGTIQLSALYENPRQLPSEKIKDIKKLMQYVPPIVVIKALLMRS